VLLNKAIENDHYPLSPGVQMLRRMRAKPPRCSTQPLPARRPTRWKSAMRHGRRRATSPGWKKRQVPGSVPASCVRRGIRNGERIPSHASRRSARERHRPSGAVGSRCKRSGTAFASQSRCWEYWSVYELTHRAAGSRRSADLRDREAPPRYPGAYRLLPDRVVKSW
jgi:hypothetical protein